MNSNILNIIDSIEMESIFSEMEVCYELIRNMEKQATILEYAVQPEDFEFFMEAAAGQQPPQKQGKKVVKQVGANKKQAEKQAKAEAKQQRTADFNATQQQAEPTPESQNKPPVIDNESQKPVDNEAELQAQREAEDQAEAQAEAQAQVANADGDSPDTPPDDDSKKTKIKGVWFKKLKLYIAKAFTAINRLIRKAIYKISEDGIEKFFKKEENAKKVPEATIRFLQAGLFALLILRDLIRYMHEAPKYKELTKFMINVLPGIIKQSKKSKYTTAFGADDIAGITRVTGTPFKFKEEYDRIKAFVVKLETIPDICHAIRHLITDKSKYDAKLDIYKEAKHVVCSSDEFKKLTNLTGSLYEYYNVYSTYFFNMIVCLKDLVKKGKACGPYELAQASRIRKYFNESIISKEEAEAFAASTEGEEDQDADGTDGTSPDQEGTGVENNTGANPDVNADVDQGNV